MEEEVMGGFVVPPEFRGRLQGFIDNPESLKEFNERIAVLWNEKLQAMAEFLKGLGQEIEEL